MSVWTQKEGIALCITLEAICPHYGCHVALTGGLLYKQGQRKDCDILFYRIRQTKQIDMEGMWSALSDIGFTMTKGFGFVYKATYNGKPVDCFFPEEEEGEYPEAAQEASQDAKADVAIHRDLCRKEVA
jgi:hypothetical protein